MISDQHTMNFENVRLDFYNKLLESLHGQRLDYFTWSNSSKPLKSTILNVDSTAICTAF